MRIDNLVPSTTKVSPPRRPSAPGPERVSGNPERDQVQLSRLSQAVASDPRIDELRLGVEAGTYQIESLEVAKKIVDEHLQQ